MDLIVVILRFLFGVPTEGSEAEPIVVRVDGRTSSGRQWLASRLGARNAMGSSELQQQGESLRTRLRELLAKVRQSLRDDSYSKSRHKEDFRSFRN